MDIVVSPVIPLPRSDINTDLIIPAEFLTTTQRTGLGQHLFSGLRKIEDDFPLNQERYQNCSILVARENFGCGSSREHAAWALRDWGIQVVLAPSFADIFYNNAMNNQLLPAKLDAAVIETILSAAAQTHPYSITVSLSTQSVQLPDGSKHYFEIDPYRKECLLKDLDDLDYLLMSLPEIEAFDQRRAPFRFCHTEALQKGQA
ncbi:MAG: 3-isopropylmalate dehydratase small subunit [Chlamydiia bacterium]|nr:3-isopropylmalate dehydratase small subunit [Chlamydiia bacterium]